MAHRRLLALASIPFLSTAVLGAVTQPAAAAAAPASATAGASYLATLVNAAGYIPTPTGGVDFSSTAQAVLAFHAAGVGGRKATAAETYLEANAATWVGAPNPAKDDPGRLALLILDAAASGSDPTAFGTAGDLVSRLVATQNRYTTDGTVDTGLFGAADPTYDGAYRQGIALAALKAAGVSGTAATTTGTQWLTGQQCEDGGWEAYRAQPSTACGAPDGTNFTGPETNSTALAVEGLLAQGVTSASSSALTFLHAVQNTDGGFGYYVGSTDPDSTALVVQALVALGQDPAGTTWTVAGHTPKGALAAFQLGCGTSTPGAFSYPGSKAANRLASLQGTLGASGDALPLSASTPAADAPSSCAAAAPTPPSPPAASPSAAAGAAASGRPAAAQTTPAVRAAPDAAILPATGRSSTLPLTGLGFGLVFAGALACAGSRRRSIRRG